MGGARRSCLALAHGHMGRLWTCGSGGNKRTPDGSFPRRGRWPCHRAGVRSPGLTLLPAPLCGTRYVGSSSSILSLSSFSLKAWPLLLLCRGPAPLTSSLLSSTPCQLQAGKQEHYQDPWGLSSFLDVKGFKPARSLSLFTKTEAQTS